jgi:predicted AAA+ superfamily ATPase
MKQELSPFLFGRTVSNSGFTNREKDLEKLYKNLTQGINTMLISPRRWGKSSLVERLILDLKTKNPEIKIVSLDLFSVSSEEEFLEMFAKEVIKASSTIWQDWLQSGKDFFKQLTPILSVGIDPVNDFSLGFDWKQLKKHRAEILELPEKIANEKKCRFIICLDEFQNLATFHEFESLEKSMRAIWQRQKSVSFCLYGSKRHMMTDIFNNPSKPFYRFGDIMLLQKIKREKWTSFIIESFAKTKKEISVELAELIPTLMQNHSWYVQQLAHYTWQKTKKKASKNEVQSAFSELIYANTPLYMREVEALSLTQLNLLKAIAKKEEKLSSVEILQKYRLGTSASVVKNKTILLKADIIDDAGGKLSFLDPAFEFWFLKQYFNQKSAIF